MPKKRNPYPVPSKTEITPVYLDTADTAKLLGVSTHQLKTWRLGNRRGNPPRLTEHIHWISFGGKRTLFHRELMLDFLANLNRPEMHEAAVMAFLKALPSSKALE